MRARVFASITRATPPKLKAPRWILGRLYARCNAGRFPYLGTARVPTASQLLKKTEVPVTLIPV
jgi:hypothetical protein